MSRVPVFPDIECIAKALCEYRYQTKRAIVDHNILAKSVRAVMPKGRPSSEALCHAFEECLHDLEQAVADGR